MPYCSVANCYNKSACDNLGSGGISYHVFPRNPSIQELWVLATGKKNFIPNKYNTICSAHFKERDYRHFGAKRLLYSWAYPTVDVWNENKKQKDLDAPGSSDTASDKPAQEIPESNVIIARVYKYFKDEYEILKAFTGNHWELNPLANYLQRTVEATGVDEKTVQMIVEEVKSSEETPAEPEQDEIIHLDVETELPVCHLKKIIFRQGTDSRQTAKEKGIHQEKSASNVTITNKEEAPQKDHCVLRSLLAERINVPDDSDESADGNDDEQKDELQMNNLEMELEINSEQIGSLLADRINVPDDSDDSSDGNDDEQEDQWQTENLKMEVEIDSEQIGMTSTAEVLHRKPPDNLEVETVIIEEDIPETETILIKEELEDDKDMLHMELSINNMISNVLKSERGLQISKMAKGSLYK